MIKKMAICALAAGAFALGGCANKVDATSLAQSITNGIKTACGFQVTADTAIQLANLAASPFVAGSSALASFLQSTVDGVCAVEKNAVAAAARPGAKAPAPMAQPTYGGVALHGSFVRS